MQVELLKSEVQQITSTSFGSLNPQLQKQVAVRVLRRRDTDAAHFVADQLLKGNPSFEFVVSDDISLLT